VTDCNRGPKIYCGGCNPCSRPCSQRAADWATHPRPWLTSAGTISALQQSPKMAPNQCLAPFAVSTDSSFFVAAIATVDQDGDGGELCDVLRMLARNRVRNPEHFKYYNYAHQYTRHISHPNPLEMSQNTCLVIFKWLAVT
jgi:hypothetical protein